jgi:transcriptional regulator with XRE-family HTH domain
MPAWDNTATNAPNPVFAIETCNQMPQDLPDRICEHHSVGADIRAMRKSRGIKLVDLAATLGRSTGFVSQIERGVSQPSINDLRKIAALFGVPISFFFKETPTDPNEARHIVRSAGRRQLGSVEAGLVEKLLSPDLGGAFEIILSEFAVGATLEEPQKRGTEEAGYVISGTFQIEISGIWHRLYQGDSFRFANESYRWRNAGDQPVVMVWVIAPPVY